MSRFCPDSVRTQATTSNNASIIPQVNIIPHPKSPHHLDHSYLGRLPPNIAPIIRAVSGKNYAIRKFPRPQHCELPLANKPQNFGPQHNHREPQKILLSKQAIPMKSLPVPNGEMERIVIIREPKDADTIKNVKSEVNDDGKDEKGPSTSKKSITETQEQQSTPKIKEECMSDEEDCSEKIMMTKKSIISVTTASQINKNIEKWNFQISNEELQPKTYEERYQELLKQVDARLTAQREKLSSVIDDIIRSKRPASMRSNSSYGSEDYTSSDDVSASKIGSGSGVTSTDAHVLKELAEIITEQQAKEHEQSEQEKKNAEQLQADSNKRGRGRPRKNIPEHVDDPLKRKQRVYHQTYWTQREQKAKIEVAQKYENILKEILRNLNCTDDKETVMKILDRNDIKL